MNRTKVRFAPSPTGPLHIGGARSALFNFLFATRYSGEMLLRIEDTDLERSCLEYEGEIIDSLEWLGLTWSEGVDIGGPNAPYRQTERLAIYQEYAAELLETGQAYYCFCSERELEAERQDLLDSGQMQKYSGKCRQLDMLEREEKLQQGIKPAIRFRVPAHQLFIVDDLVRGRVSFASDDIGDFIIMKSDGIPTYNFAVVIDDVLMDISHVIRAEEHLSNTPRQLMIYDALNFRRPEFAHISLILGSDRQKMSKRHGATSLAQYREMGYLPDALFNFLALLGWSPEGEEEIMSPAEIAAAFSLERLAKSPAVFDINKLNYINQQYLKKIADQDLKEMLKPYLAKSVYREKIEQLDEERLRTMVSAIRDYLVCLADVKELVEVFFAEIDYDAEAQEVLAKAEVIAILQAFKGGLNRSKEAGEIKQLIKDITKTLKLKPKDVFMPLRCALSGQAHGPDLGQYIKVIGKEETAKRIEQAIDFIKEQ